MILLTILNPIFYEIILVERVLKLDHIITCLHYKIVYKNNINLIYSYMEFVKVGIVVFYDINIYYYDV